MICQVFAAGPPFYRTLAEIPIGGFPDAIYFEAIPEPYGERLSIGSPLVGLWENAENNELFLAVTFDQKRWPSWDIRVQTFSGFTGEYLRQSPTFLSGKPGKWSLGYFTNKVVQDLYGGLWGYASNAFGKFFRVDPVNISIVPGSEIPFSRYPGIGNLQSFVFDEPRNRAILCGSTRQSVRVHNFTTGELLSEIPVPNFVSAICPGERTQVYVLLRDATLLALDYSTFRVVQATRVPVVDAPTLADANTDFRIAWSRKYRRLLFVQYTPDNPDGTATTLIKGYRNIPVPTHICKPIPLARSRVGQRTPVLIKQVGDLGEGIAGGAQVTATNATLTPTFVGLDGNGQGLVYATALSEGTVDLEANISVACTPDNPVAG